jgi:hypothetical protein
VVQRTSHWPTETIFNQSTGIDRVR